MDFTLDAADEVFRAELRSFLDEHLPRFLEKEADDGEDDSHWERAQRRRRAWQKVLNQGSWAAVHWPVEHGGRGATAMQRMIYSEVMAEYRAPGLYNTNGIWQIGPMIIAWGSENQKARWLPGILDGSEHWCQGFSEPDAGNDLANLRTTALRDGDRYLVNGQKIWISTAHLAKWGLFLLRTDPTAIERGAKHEGITAFIVDLQTPGVQCRPIRDITGEEMFNEVYFTDAMVPLDCRLGGEGEGWMVAMGTLGNERVGIATQLSALSADLHAMIEAARAVNPGGLGDPELRARLARCWTEIELSKLLSMRAVSKIIKGEKTWPEVQFAKLQWSALAQEMADLAIDLLGPAGVLARGGPGCVDSGKWTRLYSFQRYSTIGGGSTEIQKNIIADRAIKLPGQARLS